MPIELDPRTRKVALLTSILLIFIAISYLELQKPGPSQAGNLAPELQPTGQWFNSEPLTLAQLRGKVVLIDFWTYTCINCIRTFPYLRSWNDKYKDKGLVIIGVHTPEFNFERDPENVRKAIRDLNVTWAVVQDNDYLTWRAYRNNFWPRKYLISKEGVVVYDHIGEGGYEETELQIQKYLREAGYEITDPLTPEIPLENLERVTREIYGGYWRPSYLGSPEAYGHRDQLFNYTDPGARINGQFYLEGFWNVKNDTTVYAGNGEEASLILPYFAKSVYTVLKPKTTEGTALVYLELDGTPIPREIAGADVLYDEEGESYILQDEPRLYVLIRDRTYSSHELRLTTNSTEFQFFTFTFG